LSCTRPHSPHPRVRPYCLLIVYRYTPLVRPDCLLIVYRYTPPVSPDRLLIVYRYSPLMRNDYLLIVYRYPRKALLEGGARRVRVPERRQRACVVRRAPRGDPAGGRRRRWGGRGLHSSTFQLNWSALYGIGGARKGSVARVKGVLGGVQGVKGVFVCQTWLKLS